MTTTAARRLQASSMRRPKSCVDAEDGPWTVIVAESPYEPFSYILNVQSTSRFTIRIGETLALVASSWSLVICTIWHFHSFYLSQILIFLVVSSPELVFDGRSN